MNLLTQKHGSRVIVYDADYIHQPRARLFDPEYWAQKGGLDGTAPGRGSALLLSTEFGPAVLRRYLRGGWAAKLSRDRYVFTGFERARPVAEFRMLGRLFKRHLPVPRPLAAMCERDRFSYTGSLMTRRIREAVPFAELLDEHPADVSAWKAVGRCIRRFHDEGVVHADLNARNIMIGANGRVYLLDFDRARIRPGAKRSFEANLSRLRRSVEKLWGAAPRGDLETGWRILLDGYQQEKRGVAI